ncbi:MAG: aminomethyl-transferring glycine dehydrogenase subunit GcvPA [Pseudomonadales bacterium]|nr:aminomethyl-transferring glycine dehydrogenase subunit GcvPA [Pseudomonadales bacterium]
MPYIPHTHADERRMLETLHLQSRQQLFDEIPAGMLADALSLAEGQNEMQVMRHMAACAAQDTGARCFLGGGAYDHHVPAAVWEIAGRGEFMTAYTPYQAEASQGTLQVIYEFQSMLANLVGMDVCNASVYDGASGLAEAVLMALRVQKRHGMRKILMPSTVHPWYRQTVRSIVQHQGVELVELPLNQAGQVDRDAMALHSDAAALIIPQPNFLGVLEEADGLTRWAHQHDMLAIAVVNPMVLALLTPPGDWGDRGADITVGEAQVFGIPLSSGGPYVGFMACRLELVRQLPGRLIGRTVDRDGKPGFALTLQAREQHIRRAKATSNICTNQGLSMTAATIYLSLLGGRRIIKKKQTCHRNMSVLTKQLSEELKIVPVFDSPVFHERLFKLPVPADLVCKAMAERGFLAGLDVTSFYPELGSALLVCTTEKIEAADRYDYVAALKQVLEACA